MVMSVFIQIGLVPSLRLKLSSLSEFMREIKVGFATGATTGGVTFGETASRV